MNYEVLITWKAQQEAEANHLWWAEHRSAEQAARWYDEFLKATLSLEQAPDRFALAAENDRSPLNYGNSILGLAASRHTAWSTRFVQISS